MKPYSMVPPDAQDHRVGAPCETRMGGKTPVQRHLYNNIRKNYFLCAANTGLTNLTHVNFFSHTQWAQRIGPTCVQRAAPWRLGLHPASGLLGDPVHNGLRLWDTSLRKRVRRLIRVLNIRKLIDRGCVITLKSTGEKPCRNGTVSVSRTADGS